MNVLIIGSGGREHAIAWKVSQSARVQEVYVAPGNGGTASEQKCTNVCIAVDDIQGLVDFALLNSIGLTIVGPEKPLVMGVVDAFQQAGLMILGPSKQAALLEGSKAFCKDFLVRHQIPTAKYAVFDELAAAKAYIQSMVPPIVIKANGLADGKGVFILGDVDSAIDQARHLLVDKALGNAGKSILVEEFLLGEEASFIALVNGKNILPLATSQDHKAVFDGDKGPNTGGMGAYSPAPVVDADLHAKIMREIIRPTVNGMLSDGMPYTGFLYAGIMVDNEGNPKVLEYNCRLGDPEAQPLLMRLRSDFVALCEAACQGDLDSVACDWDPRPALGMVLASQGYPGEYVKGVKIGDLPADHSSDSYIFHSGTTVNGDGGLVTDGGRVLCVTAMGANVEDAQNQAINISKAIAWKGAHFRTDIGYRAIAREQARH